MPQSILRIELERLSFSKSLILRKKNESEERVLKRGRKKNTTSTFKVMLKP